MRDRKREPLPLPLNSSAPSPQQSAGPFASHLVQETWELHLEPWALLQLLGTAEQVGRGAADGTRGRAKKNPSVSVPKSMLLTLGVWPPRVLGEEERRESRVQRRLVHGSKVTLEGGS